MCDVCRVLMVGKNKNVCQGSPNYGRLHYVFRPAACYLKEVKWNSLK